MKGETLTNYAFLKSLVYTGAEKKKLPFTNTYIDRISYELNIIRNQKCIDYFILYARIIEIINELHLLRSPGRNTAPCSLVNFCLDITKIDPIAEGPYSNSHRRQRSDGRFAGIFDQSGF